MKYSSNSSATQVALALLIAGTLVSVAEAASRKFYLTNEVVQGNQALTACAKGYHMASLWEIREPSALTYNTKLGFVTADSGSGPPANFSGWIRTGNISNTSTIAGSANCAVWSSNGSSDHGTNVFLSAFWTEAAVGISPWASENVQCSSTFHVWCVAGK